MRLVALIFVVHVKPEDISWNSPVIPFVSVLEVYIALIASSVPAIYPLACRSRFFSCWRSKKSDQQPRTEEAWGSNVDTLTYSSDLAAINDSHSSNDPKWFRLKWGRSKSETTVAPTRMEDIPITDIRQAMKSRPSFAPCIPSLPQVLPRYLDSQSGSYTQCQELNWAEPLRGINLCKAMVGRKIREGRRESSFVSEASSTADSLCCCMDFSSSQIAYRDLLRGLWGDSLLGRRSLVGERDNFLLCMTMGDACTIGRRTYVQVVSGICRINNILKMRSKLLFMASTFPTNDLLRRHIYLSSFLPFL